MDLLAALALVFVLEGLAIAIFSGSVPEVLAAMRGVDGTRLRMAGIIIAVSGGALYLLIRA